MSTLVALPELLTAEICVELNELPAIIAIMTLQPAVLEVCGYALPLAS